MDLFIDGENLHKSFHKERIYSKPRRDGAPNQNIPLSIKQFPRSFDVLKEWANSSTTLKIVRREPPKPNAMLPEPPQLSYSKAGKQPNILPDRYLLNFAFLDTSGPKEAAASTKFTMGQQMTRIQKYTESLEQRRRGLIDEFLQYVNTIISCLYVDIDQARINFQDYLSSLDARFLALIKEPGMRPQIMNTSLHTLSTEAMNVFTKLHAKSDKLATMLRTVITDAIKTLSIGLKDACCTEAEILSYISEIVRQTEERMNGACATMLMFIEASKNRTLASIEDGRGLCYRVIYQKKVELVCDFVEQYLSFIHHEHEFSPTIMEAIHAVNHSFQHFSADLLNFIAGLSIKTEHPRDMAVRLVRDILLPHKEKIHLLMEEVQQRIDDVHISLTESNNDVIGSLEQLSILDEGLNSLIVETLSHWSKRWSHRITLLRETATRVMHANSFFISCLIAVFGAADMAIKHTTALEDKWRRLCDETMKAIEERFTRDWSRSTACLEYINTNITNVWEVSEAKQVKKISGELLEAVEEAIVRREQQILQMTGPSPTDSIVLSTLIDIVSLGVKEASFLTLLGTVADQDAKLLNTTTLFNDSLLKIPMENISPKELTDHNSVLLHKMSYPDSMVDIWSCADYPIQVFDDLIKERSADLNVLSRLAAANKSPDETPSSVDNKAEEALREPVPQNKTPVRSTSKKSDRAATPNTDRSRATSKGKIIPDSVSEASREPTLLIDPPLFERDINLDAYRTAYGFSYFQDGSTPIDLITEIEQRFSAEPVVKEKGKQTTQTTERKCTIIDLITSGYQQVMFSKEISYDSTYACVFITLPLDLRLILYHALLRLVYADGERVAYNKAVSDFKERINNYRKEYLEKLNAAATEAHAAAVTEWEKETAKKGKTSNKSKQTPSRPESGQDESRDADKPSAPEPITELPDYVEEAIANIQVPAEKQLDEREIYIRLVYAVLDYDHLKIVPLTQDQEYPTPANPALVPHTNQPAPQTKDPKKTATQPPLKPLLLKPYEKSEELIKFEQIIANPKYSVSADEMMFDSCIYDGTRETLERLIRMAMSIKSQVTRPNTSTINIKRPSSKSISGDRQLSSKVPSGEPGGGQSIEALIEQRIDKLLTLARPDEPAASSVDKSVNRSTSKPIIKDTPLQLRHQKVISNIASPLGVLGSNSVKPASQEESCITTSLDILTDCRMYTSSESLTIKLFLGNISSSILTIIMSRFVETYSKILSNSINNKRRILTISDDLRASLVPYTVRLLHTEVAQIESRCSRYIGIEYRVLNRALSIITTLRKRILDVDISSADTIDNMGNPSGSKSTSAGAGGARASSRGKQAIQPGENRYYQEALTSLSQKGLDRFVRFTFDSTKGIISSVCVTKQLSEFHPLFRHTADIYAKKFDKAVNENIILFPEQADRIVIYACDAFIAECKAFFKKSLSVLALNDIGAAERIAYSFSKQAAGWSGFDNIGPFDFTVADLPVALLRNNYDEIKPLIDTASGPVGVHPAIEVAKSLISTIHMLREELYSRLVTDLVFFKYLMMNVSKAIRLANTEYNLKKSKVDTMKKKCYSIKTMILNRLFFFREKMNSINETFIQAAKCPNRLSLNTLFSNSLLAVKSSFELEQIAYYLSYFVDLRFIFYTTDLLHIDQRHTYMLPYDLFQQRSKAFHAFSGILLGVISATINALCSTKALQSPFSFQEEIKERVCSPFNRAPSQKISSPKQLTRKNTKFVSRTVDLQCIDIYELGSTSFSQFQQFTPNQTTYKPGAKVFYDNSIECDIGNQLQMELGAMLTTYSTFQPVYVPTEAELANAKLSGLNMSQPNDIEIVCAEEPPKQDKYSSRPNSALSVKSATLQQASKQVILPATTIKRLTDSMFPDEFSLLQHYYQEFYRDVANLTANARKQLHILLVQRDQLFETLIKQFIASAFEITYQTIQHIWRVYAMEHKTNNTTLSQKSAKVYDEFRPMLVKFPERITSMQTLVKESISDYLTANQLIRDSLRKDLQILLTITNCLLITAPAVLLSLYPSWADDARMAYCASLQLPELLSFVHLSSTKSDVPSKGQVAVKKRPGSGAKTEQVAPVEDNAPHGLLRLLYDEAATKALADSCILQKGTMVSCSMAFVQTLQLIESAMNAGKAIFEIEDIKALPTVSSDQVGTGKASEQLSFLSGTILPHSGIDFSSIDTIQLETLAHTLMGKDTLLTDLPILDKLTHLHLDEITLKLLEYSLKSATSQQDTLNKGKDKGKALPESKKASGNSSGADDLIPPPVVYYKLGHVTLPLIDGAENNLEDKIFTQFPAKLQTLVGCSYRALKVLLKSLNNTQRLNNLVGDHLKEASIMEKEASVELERMKDEFKQAFQLLKNPNLLNFTI